MALITCRDCQKQYSSDLKRCLHCGAKRPAGNATTWWLKMLLACVFLYVLIVHLPDGAWVPDNASVPDIDAAPQMCQQFVKDSLHDPDSAQFDVWTNYAHELTKGGVYHVQVTLRAKNGFNALRKMTVDCRVTHVSGKTWRLISLKEIRS